jgi:hypothetical protein
LATSTDGTNWYQYNQPLPNNFTGLNYGSGPYDFDVSLTSDGNRLVCVGVTNSSFQLSGCVYTSDLLVKIQPTNSQSSKVLISGLVGRN